MLPLHMLFPATHMGSKYTKWLVLLPKHCLLIILRTRQIYQHFSKNIVLNFFLSFLDNRYSASNRGATTRVAVWYSLVRPRSGKETCHSPPNMIWIKSAWIRINLKPFKNTLMSFQNFQAFNYTKVGKSYSKDV